MGLSTNQLRIIFFAGYQNWWFNGDFLMVLQWVNNGEEWDDMGFTLW